MKMKRSIQSILMIAAVTMLILTGCSTDNGDGEANGDEPSAQGGYPMTVVDSLGNEVTLEEEPQKIVSVSPTLTETIFAIGAGDKMVGRTEYCNYPEEAQELEVIGGFADPNTELILELEPDLVFSSGPVPEESLALFEGSDIDVLVIDGKTVDEIMENITKLGSILSVEDQAAQVNEEIQSEREEVKDKLGDVEAKRVFVDLGNFFSAGSGSYIHSIIEDEIGAINVAGQGEGEWPMMSLEQIVEADPQVYFYTPMGDEELEEMEGLKDTTAFVEGNVIEVQMGSTENDIMTRAGARVGKTIRFFAESVYPEAFE
ncbi:MAG TPA: hypothetical protein DHN33_10965 [Eubacteriaceae bacterium]|nr:hypothetical protein [Eubacteriaceae bacterium]